MVDTRLPDDWLDGPPYADLTDAAWRLFTGILMHCNKHLTDGRINATSLRFAYPGNPDEALRELVDAELLEDLGEHLQVIDWGKTQRTRAMIEQQREAWKERQRRHRHGVTPDVTPGETPEVTTGGDTGRESRRVSGREGKGRAVPSSSFIKEGGNTTPSVSHAVTDSEPPRFCPEHPNGTDKRCWPCGEARKKHEAWETRHKPATDPYTFPEAGWQIAAEKWEAARKLPAPRPAGSDAIYASEEDGHEHKWLTNGTCALCGVQQASQGAA